MPKIVITTTQEIDVENLLTQFKNSWKTEFDGTKKTCAMMFEDLVFGQHMAPSQAQQIVEAVRHHFIQKNYPFNVKTL